jgi:hypothetical protein
MVFIVEEERFIRAEVLGDEKLRVAGHRICPRAYNE